MSLLSSCSTSTYIWTLLLASAVYLFFRYLYTPNARLPPQRPAWTQKEAIPRGTGSDMICTEPATGKVIGTIKAYTKADVAAAYASASRAAKGPENAPKEGWMQTSFQERRAVLQDILDWVVANQEEIITMAVRDSGKTVTEAAMGEVMITCEKLRWLIANGEECLQREYRPVAALLAFTKQAYVDYKPLGVIGVIVPWNYPFHNVLSAVSAALISGNGAIVKVSEFASFSASRIEEVLRSILIRRGHNPALIHVITGMAETGSSLVSCGVDKVLFIGSPAVGKLVMRQASETLTPVILELGGKDPFIIFDDAEFEHVVDIAIRGAFINCGQNCISAERFYVQSGIYDKFVAEVTKRVSALKQGCSSDSNRCDFGAITLATQVNNFNKLLEKAVAAGAKVVCGGKQTSTDGKGCFFPPTIVTGVKQSMDLVQEEAFGPIMTIVKFEKEEEVISYANSTIYGLGSCVFTTDYVRAERVTSALRTGMTSINDFGMVPMIQSLPFGGVGASGFGCFNGKEGLRGFSRTHAVVTDRFPVRSQTPKFLQYPVSKEAHRIAQSAVSMIYGPSWTESMNACVRMVKGIMKA